MKIEQVNFYQGELLIKAKDKDSTMYIILKGKVKVVVTDEKKKEQVEVAVLNPNDFVGEAALLLGEPRKADVIAIEDVTAVPVNSKEELLEYIKQNPEFAIGMMTILANRVEKMTSSYIQAYGNLQYAKEIIAENVSLLKSNRFK